MTHSKFPICFRVKKIVEMDTKANPPPASYKTFILQRVPNIKYNKNQFNLKKGFNQHNLSDLLCPNPIRFCLLSFTLFAYIATKENLLK